MINTAGKFSLVDEPFPPREGAADYGWVRNRLTRLLIQYTLVESLHKYQKARQAYPFVHPSSLKPGSVTTSREYSRHNNALMILLDGLLPRKIRKHFRCRESNCTRKKNIAAVAPNLPGLDDYQRAMRQADDPQFERLIRMLLPLDYALMIQNEGEPEGQDDFALTHFHVRIERLTDNALRDLGIQLNYLNQRLYEQGDEFVDLFEKKYFEYFNFYHNASGRKMAAATSCQLLAKQQMAATVFIASQQDRRLTLLSSRREDKELEITQYILLKLSGELLHNFIRWGEETGVPVRERFFVMEQSRYAVAVMRVRYCHTEAAMPTPDGKIRERLNFREKWVRLVDEAIVSIHPEESRVIHCALVYRRETGDEELNG